MRRARLLLLAAGFALSACTLTPPYHRPDPDAAAEWREAPQAVPAPGIRSGWWRAFGSAELDALMAQAEAQNLDLAAAVARVEQADAQARISGAALLPSLDATGRAQRTKEIQPNSGVRNNYSLGGMASYEADFWGRNRASLNAATETAIAASFDREVVRLSTQSSVADSFFETVALAMRVAVAERNLATARKLLDGLRKEFAVGTVTSLDVTQQETLVAALAATIPPLQQQRAQKLDALAILVGEQPERIALATGSFDALATPVIAPGLPSELLRRRPDVRESEARLLAANYDIGNARAQFFPDISLTAQGGIESAQLAKLFTPQGLIYDLVASITQPIFEGGRLRGQLDYARARYREELADYRKAVIAAFSDVEDGLAAVSRTRQALDQQQVALDRARTALRMVQVQFRVGTVNIVQVLQIEQSLFQQEESSVEAQLAQLESYVVLAKALGGGWSDRPGPPTPEEFHARPASGGPS